MRGFESLILCQKNPDHIVVGVFLAEDEIGFERVAPVRTLA